MLVGVTCTFRIDDLRKYRVIQKQDTLQGSVAWNHVLELGGVAQAPPPKRDRFLLAPAHAPAGGAGVRARGGGMARRPAAVAGPGADPRRVCPCVTLRQQTAP